MAPTYDGHALFNMSLERKSEELPGECRDAEVAEDFGSFRV